MVTGECTLPDDTNLNITFDNSSISQSAIVSTTGWICDTFTELVSSVSDLMNDLTNNTFGFVKNTDILSQSQVDSTDYGWISSTFQYFDNIKANLDTPTFTNKVTFPNGSVISQYEQYTTIPTMDYVSNLYALKTDGIIDNPSLTGDVSFPDGSQLTPDTETTTFRNDRALYNTTFIDTFTETWTTRTILDF